ncbi:phage minor tail protein L [Herbaspirillum huttiense]|uniref:Phage minor tail protein L n=1 Tax=Herbaspirillum huttiense subsp. lycopersici TaxID=3074428 RepID=A0ABU2EGP6_9BURK|nr:phage minor tail protein L [Herbaspirillum huttiense]MDR9847013.1 phage minor tail protein L [Herbaspirillum huttiense SE1]
MSIKSEIQKLAPSALIELFILDATKLPGGGLMRFHAGTNKLQQPVIWQGQEYMPLPIEAEGFEMNTRGTLPRPKIRVANVNGMFSAQVTSLDDLVRAKVIRKRTYARFLDAVNFPDGNPTADPTQSLPDEVWYVERKTTENRYLIEWELASAFDLQGVQCPSWQIIQNSCSWRYRGPECGYAGAPMDRNNQWTTPANDTCPKNMAGCRARHGNGELPFGGFPGATRYG